MCLDQHNSYLLFEGNCAAVAVGFFAQQLGFSRFDLVKKGGIGREMFRLMT
jgi:hypothetical protein